jgi:hypothetical protein
MKTTALTLLLCLFIAANAPAATLKLPPATEIAFEANDDLIPFPLTAGLLLPDELRSTIHVVKTSPFDRIKYPIGDYTVDLFGANLPQVFAKVVEIGEGKNAGVDVVVRIEIVRFEAVIPRPASNPYTATMVYKITVQDPDGETLLVQTVTGDGQTSKGMMSGFKAKSLAGESAVRAMSDACRQALEALADAPEVAEISISDNKPVSTTAAETGG